MLHSNGELRTDRAGDAEKGCQKPAVQQKTSVDDDGSDNLTRLTNRQNRTQTQNNETQSGHSEQHKTHSKET